MIYLKNLPLWERSLRIGAGVVAGAYGVLNAGEPLGWLVLAAGAGIALTGIYGYCPACALAGRGLEKRAQQESGR
ncbi:MAG: DUF2892 domain-containing protein [Betaproteobacteria bacterium]|nr:DUF2892 domain-containing protein [Betaproteobacteria bacterium]